MTLLLLGLLGLTLALVHAVHSNRAHATFRARVAQAAQPQPQLLAVLESVVPPQIKVRQGVSLPVFFQSLAPCEGFSPEAVILPDDGAEKIDFLLVRASDGAPLAAIGLDDGRADESVERALDHAGIPFSRIPARPAPSAEAVRAYVERLVMSRLAGAASESLSDWTGNPWGIQVGAPARRRGSQRNAAPAHRIFKAAPPLA